MRWCRKEMTVRRSHSGGYNPEASRSRNKNRKTGRKKRRKKGNQSWLRSSRCFVSSDKTALETKPVRFPGSSKVAGTDGVFLEAVTFDLPLFVLTARREPQPFPSLYFTRYHGSLDMGCCKTNDAREAQQHLTLTSNHRGMNPYKSFDVIVSRSPSLPLSSHQVLHQGPLFPSRASTERGRSHMGNRANKTTSFVFPSYAPGTSPIPSSSNHIQSMAAAKHNLPTYCVVNEAEKVLVKASRAVKMIQTKP
ncbi:hypothetical protein B0T13DRAFT_500970 [Neurospora crassa]|nr:hypothetical protein B0T13DRAFT_500970 [Neurospora crassa]